MYVLYTYVSIHLLSLYINIDLYQYLLSIYPSINIFLSIYLSFYLFIILLVGIVVLNTVAHVVDQGGLAGEPGGALGAPVSKQI